MEFTQKRMANHIRFEFGPTELRFWIRDNSGERDLTADYADLPSSTRRVFEKNTWVRNVGYLWCVIGAVAVAAAAIAGTLSPGSAFWLALGVACLGFYRATQTTYTVLDANAGSIWIIEDKQLATILNELQSRRKTRLLDIYGTFNPNNDPEREAQKFDWLVKEKILTREEANHRLGRSGVPVALPGPPDRLLH
jgi:hypothetical protein